MANRNIENVLGEIFVPGAAPSAPTEGQVYYDSTAHALQVRGAAAWTTPVTGNAAIVAGTNTKITYDTKGLVTAGAAATTADIADSADKRYCTDAQKTIIGNTSGTNSGNVTLAAVGAAPNANGASITGQIINLQPASASFPGTLSATDFVKLSNLSGTNTGDQNLSGYAQLTGAAFTGYVAATPASGFNSFTANPSGAGAGFYVNSISTTGVGFSVFADCAHGVFAKATGTGVGVFCANSSTGPALVIESKAANPTGQNGAVSILNDGTLNWYSTTWKTAATTSDLTAKANLSGATFTGEIIVPDVKCNPGSAPATPAEGQVYYDDTAHTLRFRNASGWVDCSGGSMGSLSFGSTPNANAHTITGGMLQMQPADATHPGGVSTTAQAFAGTKTFANIISPTVYNTNGGSEGQICVKIGTSVADGSTFGTLLSVRTGIGGTEVEAFKVEKVGATINGWLATTVASGTAVTGSGGSVGCSGSGTEDGVYGASTTAAGHGVHGSGGSVGCSGSGTVDGVYGTSATAAGHGVHGFTSAGYHGICGVYGSEAGVPTTTAGVMGFGSTSTWGGYFKGKEGVCGLATNGSGVYGESTGGTGYGVYGNGSSVGVYGETTNGSAVSGKSTGGSGYGVLGEGSVAGVRGQTAGGDYGIQASNTNTAGGTHYGLHASCTSAGTGDRTGILGSGGTYGVYGISSSGYSVYGTSGGTYSVYGESTVSTIDNAYGVYGRCWQTGGGMKCGVGGIGMSVGIKGYGETDCGIEGTSGTGNGVSAQGNATSAALLLKGNSSQPSSTTQGQIYFNSTDKHFYGYNGTTWKQLDN